MAHYSVATRLVLLVAACHLTLGAERPEACPAEDPGDGTPWWGQKCGPMTCGEMYDMNGYWCTMTESGCWGNCGSPYCRAAPASPAPPSSESSPSPSVPSSPSPSVPPSPSPSPPPYTFAVDHLRVVSGPCVVSGQCVHGAQKDDRYREHTTKTSHIPLRHYRAPCNAPSKKLRRCQAACKYQQSAHAARTRWKVEWRPGKNTDGESPRDEPHVYCLQYPFWIVKTKKYSSN